MSWKHISATLVCALTLLASPVHAADAYPLAQGLHQWPAGGGKLMLVVGTYQDTTSFHRSYSFYFKTVGDDAWNQVAVPENGGGQFTWNSGSHGEFTLSDAIAVQRPDGVYFVVADKRMAKGAGYADKRDVNVTWYKLILADDDHPDDVPYQFKPAFKRSYPQSAQTVEAILAREATLQPRK